MIADTTSARAGIKTRQVLQNHPLVFSSKWFNSCLAALTQRLVTWLATEIPEGYQDESGFHYGTPSQ
jgi:hypothetical protein